MREMGTVDEMVVAVLHDILEDTFATKEILAQFFPDKLVDAISTLTKAKEETYGEYINRIAASGDKIAIKVKKADLMHNMDFSRVSPLTEQDERRMKKYKKAWDKLFMASCQQQEN
jgi:(p)ppGpp synthase/HD superfamily hydrolase